MLPSTWQCRYVATLTRTLHTCITFLVPLSPSRSDTLRGAASCLERQVQNFNSGQLPLEYGEDRGLSWQPCQVRERVCVRGVACGSSSRLCM